MKRHVLITLSILFAFFITHSLLFAENDTDFLDVPLKTIIIKAPDPSKAKKTPVLFSHSTHVKFSCTACHHNWDRENAIQGCSAEGCHERIMPAPPNGKPSQKKDVMSITGAYHQACRSCHREYQKEMLKFAPKMAEAAPVACDGCHPKNFSGEESDEGSFSLPLGNLELAPPEGAIAKRATVNFPHGLHFDQDCGVCHHEWDGVSEVQSCSASDCHDQAEPDESTRNINDPVNVQYFLTAYHKACYSCHLDLNKLAKTSDNAENVPPVLCSDCHNGELP